MLLTDYKYYKKIKLNKWFLYLFTYYIYIASVTHTDAHVCMYAWLLYVWCMYDVCMYVCMNRENDRERAQSRSEQRVDI